MYICVPHCVTQYGPSTGHTRTGKCVGLCVGDGRTVPVPVPEWMDGVLGGVAGALGVPGGVPLALFVDVAEYGTHRGPGYATRSSVALAPGTDVSLT